MPDDSPARVPCEVDSLTAPAGRATIRLEVPLHPISPEVAAQMLALFGAAQPPGIVQSYAGATAPSGWLLCDGALVSRTTFAALFAVIGETFGAGDASTTFAVPDLRGRVIAGVDDMGGSAALRLHNLGGSGYAGLGDAFGEDQHTLDASEIPAHTHTQPAHTHSVSSPSSTGGSAASGSDVANIWTGSGSGATGSAGDDATGSAGGGVAHINAQPTLTLNFIIKT